MRLEDAIILVQPVDDRARAVVAEVRVGGDHVEARIDLAEPVATHAVLRLGEQLEVELRHAHDLLDDMKRTTTRW